MPDKKPLPVGMSLSQLRNMLDIAEQKGATHVLLSCQTRVNGEGVQSPIEWVSQTPVDGIVYIGAYKELDQWEHMDNRALESLDW